ncbi:MAG: ribosomal-protein-alanine N-acetyltransferase [Clostridia bacterium]|nr:ribosomal-protein-alanine N-acetyltransferase [Clostridia bacterium]
MTDFTITYVKPEYLDNILEIENRCFSVPWTRTALENQMNDKKSIFLAAVDGGRVLGYIGMLAVLDEGYISNVAVAPDCRRRGIAGALIDAVIARKRDELAFITLEVRTSNLPAIALYRKHGFTEVGRRKNYYDRPKEDAVIMTLFFKPEA